MKVIDITKQLEEPEEMALCPICDNVITEGEPVAIGKAFGVVSLVHEICCE